MTAEDRMREQNEPDDPLLRALGEIERDHEQRHPGEWEDVLAGRVPAATAAAARAGVDPPAEHAAFSAMFGAKIGDAEVERLVARASRSLADEARPPAPSVVTPLRRRVQVAVAVVLAIAAALVLWILPGEAPRGTPIAYVLTVRNAAIEPVRSSDTGTPRPSGPELTPRPSGPELTDVAHYRGDSEIDWVLSPEATTAAEVTLQVVARADDGREVTVTPVFTRSSAGALRLRGRFAEVLPGLPPGRWQLRFVVDEREVGARLAVALAE
jgi:hypothetical protein